MKVGKYEIPDIRISSLIKPTKDIYDKWPAEEPPSQEAVALVLGHKTAKSGAFLSKLAWLRDYGLIEKKGLRVTELGKKLTYDPDEKERKKAQNDAVLKIPLWKEFYDRWKFNPPEEKFWANLMSIVTLEAPDAQKIEKEVREAYMKDISGIKEDVAQGGKGQETSEGDKGAKEGQEGGKPNEKRDLNVNINIQVNLPEKGDADQYDKIFAAIKKHLLAE